RRRRLFPKESDSAALFVLQTHAHFCRGLRPGRRRKVPTARSRHKENENRPPACSRFAQAPALKAVAAPKRVRPATHRKVFLQNALRYTRRGARVVRAGPPAES